MLKAQEASLLGEMSKAKVISVIDKKINLTGTEGDSLAKSFYKQSGGGVGTKQFLEQYLEKRKAFHKYQILKVCVNKNA